jgi:heptosyltransferase-2
LPEFGIIYRPLDNPAADALVKRSRERFGMRLLSRKTGFQEALKILRRQGFVGVLFDQNAGLQGALTTLFGRVCSTTELPGLMAEKFSGRVYGVYPRRLGFWRVELNVVPVPTDGTSAGTTIALNRWLEGLLTSDENVCASWLWSHDRWRNQDIPAKRFRLEAKRNLLDADSAARGLTELPRRTRLWVRLPNWLGDVVMVLPLLRALRASRPDAELTLIGKATFAPLVQSWGVADRYEPLPPHGVGYFRHFWRQRHAYPDVYVLFTNSLRGDLEAWLTRCPQRFGLVRRGKPRPLLSHAYRVPADFDEQQHHQLELWETSSATSASPAPPISRPSNPQSAIRNPQLPDRRLGKQPRQTLARPALVRTHRGVPTAALRALRHRERRRDHPRGRGGFSARPRDRSRRPDRSAGPCRAAQWLHPSRYERYGRHASRQRPRRTAHRTLRTHQPRTHRPRFPRGAPPPPAARRHCPR